MRLYSGNAGRGLESRGTLFLRAFTADASMVLTGGTIKCRNFADSADAPITASNITASGALQIGNAAVAETPVATHTLIIKDSTGTSYRVLAVAV